MYHWWGIGLIGAGLALVVAFFSGAGNTPAAAPTTVPTVILPPEPTPGWPGALWQVRIEEAETRGDEDVEDIILLPPQSLAATPLPESQETTQPDSSPPRLPVFSPHRLIASSPLLGWPINGGEVTQGFGCSPYYTGLAGPGCPAEAPWFHDGLDIGATTGAPVRAALTGTVLFAGSDGSGPECGGGYRGYGLAVVVDNGAGWQALYAHLSQVQVLAGQAITPDTIIGQVGTTGCVSGAHLHFGLRYSASHPVGDKGELVDPAKWQE